ncbi:hypothetical protein SLA2020_255080 [Shorea laevis]
MHRSDIFCLLETKSDSHDDSMAFMARFGYDEQYQVLSQGKAGGLWLFWKSTSVSLVVLSASCQDIHCLIDTGPSHWFLTLAYTQPNNSKKEEFWTLMRARAATMQGSWFVIGDMNDVLSAEEVSPIPNCGFSRAQVFRDRLDDCGLFAKEALGCHFTWTKKRNGRTVLMERLDRAVLNLRQWKSFSTTKLINLPRLCSDHHPILLNIQPNSAVRHPRGPPRFEAAWLTREDFGAVFKNA